MEKLTPHICQSDEWGEFKTKMGTPAVRVGGVQFTVHRLPFINGGIGYCPKAKWEKINFKELYQAGKTHGCLFVKIEPNNLAGSFKLPPAPRIARARPIFATHTILLDLTATEERLLAKMHPKTRYNIRLAGRGGVTIEERADPDALETFIKLQEETAKRQKFFVHPGDYYRTCFKTLHPRGLAYLLLAVRHQKPKTVLAAWMLFRYGATLYYPYGGASYSQRKFMASNLLMWEAIRLGKRLGCTVFDMWGATGERNNPWYGFTRFKLGYGGELVELAGAYDLIINPAAYPLITAADKMRRLLLNLKREIV